MKDKRRLKSAVRSITGGVAVIVLLSLITLDTVHPDITLSLEHMIVLVAVISALLAVDISLEKAELPFSLDVEDGALKLGWKKQSGDGGSDDND